MKLTASTLRRLIRLAEGESLPSSELRGAWSERLLEDEMLIASTQGSRKKFRAVDTASFRKYVEDKFEISNLEKAHNLLVERGGSRAEQVKVTGDSKYVAARTFKGFLLNSYEPIQARLGEDTIVIAPPDGTFMFVSDYEKFEIPADITVVGVENAENFRYVARQKYLFERFGRVLFVSRYLQNQNKDLIKWLEKIPNPYVHFGDLDLAGIGIFQSEYASRIGRRASFLVPDDYEERLRRGSRERYDTQLERFRSLHTTDPSLARLLEAIHTIHRGYDQEGYILDPIQKFKV